MTWGPNKEEKGDVKGLERKGTEKVERFFKPGRELALKRTSKITYMTVGQTTIIPGNS